MPQTSYDYTHPIGFPGMLADSARTKMAESYFSEETGSTEIPLGVMVRQGTADKGCLKLTATTNVLVGVTLHHHANVYGTGGGYTTKQPVPVLTKGRVIVTVEDAVTKSSAVYVRAVATGGEVAGAFRGTADGTDTIRLWGARFRASASAAGLTILEFDMEAYFAGAAAAVA